MERGEDRVDRLPVGGDLARLDHRVARVDAQGDPGPAERVAEVPLPTRGVRRAVGRHMHRLGACLDGQRHGLSHRVPPPDHEPGPTLGQRPIEVEQALGEESVAIRRPAEEPGVEHEEREDGPVGDRGPAGLDRSWTRRSRVKSTTAVM